MRRVVVLLIGLGAAMAAAPSQSAQAQQLPVTITALPVSPGDTLTVAFSATRDSLYKVIPGLRVVIAKQGSGFIIFRIWRRDSASKLLQPIFGASVFTSSDSSRMDIRNALNKCDSSLIALHFRGDTALSQPWTIDPSCGNYSPHP